MYKCDDTSVEDFVATLPVDDCENSELPAESALTSCSFRLRFDDACRIVDEALEKFGTDGLAVSFNGGKDACAVFHIVRYVLKRRNLLELFGSSSSSAVKIVYFEDSDDFSEVLDIMEQYKSTYNVIYTQFKCPFRDGMVECVKNGMKAIVMGLRMGDPHSNGATVFLPSTSDWPHFIRVNPILHWTYSDGIRTA